MKKTLTILLEWIRPVGIGVIIFLALSFGTDDVSVFHILGPWVVVLMSGSVGLESLILGETASAKVGYLPNRAYQVQSALNNLATAFTALLVYVLEWGRFADAAITCAMLTFFVFSAANHTATAVRDRNFKVVNLLRPVMTLALLAILIPPLIKAVQ